MKLYVPEDGHEAIRSIEFALAVSALARIEVPAAFWRKQRSGEIDPGDVAVLTQAFELDYFGTDMQPPRFRAVAIAGALLDEAARRLAEHNLRALDAIQLASALAAREADPTCATFACFDSDLRAAAAAAGFSLTP